MRILITGGCGFIGSNLCAHLLEQGHKVLAFDNLVRRSSQLNLEWLKGLGEKRFRYCWGDVRNPADLKMVFQKHHFDFVLHTAAQTAVTTSLENPRHDFDVNARGTLNVLEAVRLHSPKTAVIFTSTNKVYGALEHYHACEEPTRYRFSSLHFRENGISEDEPLDFVSPYGCSKGAADQYVRDYARVFGLKTVVFRMSCQYGPRQFGTIDQGWISHFVISALLGRPLKIFGNGKQVRDVLFIADLLYAFDSVMKRIDKVSGEVFNIGGGMKNTWSLIELIAQLEREMGERMAVQFLPARSGDQLVFISDIRKAEERLDWKPRVDSCYGVQHYLAWASENLPQIKKLIGETDGS